jgi:hypothetical protein
MDHGTRSVARHFGAAACFSYPLLPAKAQSATVKGVIAHDGAIVTGGTPRWVTVCFRLPCDSTGVWPLPSPFVGFLFLVETLLQQRDAIPVAQWFGHESGCRSGDLVMLDRLRCRDEGCIENGLVLDFARELIGFPNDAVDCWAVHALRFQAGKLGHLLQLLHVVLSLVQMGLKALLLAPPVPPRNRRILAQQ